MSAVCVTAKELRKLVADIEALCALSPVVSIVTPIISNCVDHISAIAAVHERNMQLALRQGLAYEEEVEIEPVEKPRKREL